LIRIFSKRHGLQRNIIGLKPLRTKELMLPNINSFLYNMFIFRGVYFGFDMYSNLVVNLVINDDFAGFHAEMSFSIL